MVVWDTERLQIISTNKASRLQEETLGRTPKCSLSSRNIVETSRPDYRGDDEKIMSALQSGIEYSDNERREFYNQTKHHLEGEDGD